ncbi:hypothetical protein Scep_022163 [Stephania cephalantha]|uniref:Uncharacterized protein n=1 Tax=Stephania cephalantha TaxID=152367 RepID=A0AAP0F5M3_9MAGN
MFVQSSLVRVMQLKQHLQTIKKENLSVSDYMLKIKTIGDGIRASGQNVDDIELISAALNGLGHEYDPVVVLVSHNIKNMHLQDVQYSLMIHEQRIEQFNHVFQLNFPGLSANVENQRFVSQNDGGFNHSNRNGGNKGKGKWNNQKIYCQLCQKPGHGALFEVL